MSERAYEYLANNLSDAANEPVEATRLATNAVRHGLNQARGIAPRNGRRRLPASTRVIRVRARPGRRIVIELV